MKHTSAAGAAEANSCFSDSNRPYAGIQCGFPCGDPSCKSGVVGKVV